jgi:type IV pilus assembly protein PilQ
MGDNGLAAATADKISSVQAQDQGDQVVVRLTGNGSFGNSSFKKLGERQFALELEGVQNDATQAPVSNLSKKLKYLYVDCVSPSSVRLVGATTFPLKEHTLASPQDGLILNLYPLDPQASPLPVASRVPLSRPITQTTARETPRPSLPVSVTPAAFTKNQPSDKVESALARSNEYNGKPISLDLQDTDVKNVLRLLADVSGMNLVVEPDVAGKVTLKVEKVPWDQVLDMVLLMNSLDKQQSGNVVRIANRSKLDAERREHGEKIKVEQQLAETTLYSGEMSTVYFTLNYASPASFQTILSKMMSERGKVSIDDRTNSVIYSDYPYFLNNAKQLLARLDKPKSQVLIEARIVRVNTSYDWQVGFEWSWGTDKNTFLNDFQVNVPVSANALMGFSLGRVAGNSIDVELTALETTGEGKVISAPRVLTLDGIEAVISQGVEVPYLQLSDSGTASTAFRKAVLELKVKPHITPDGKVRMEVHAKKEDPDFSQSIGSTGQPPIDTREIITELIIDNGNTVVIGGVIEDTESLSQDRTPGLSSIPIVGNLFTANKSTSEKNELLIFITPRVVGVGSPEGVPNSDTPIPGSFRQTGL